MATVNNKQAGLTKLVNILSWCVRFLLQTLVALGALASTSFAASTSSLQSSFYSGVLIFSDVMVAKSDNFELRVINEGASEINAIYARRFNNLENIPPEKISSVYVLTPGVGNMDYFNYFSDGEKFDVSEFQIQSFTDLQSKVLEGRQALKQGSGESSDDSIRFTLQSDSGQVTVMIQHAAKSLSANNFVFASSDNMNVASAGSP